MKNLIQVLIFFSLSISYVAFADGGGAYMGRTSIRGAFEKESAPVLAIDERKSNLCVTAYGSCLSRVHGEQLDACSCLIQDDKGNAQSRDGQFLVKGLVSPLCVTPRDTCEIPGVAPLRTDCMCYGVTGKIALP